MSDDCYEPETLPPCEAQNTIRTRQTYVDGCPVLPKLRCHEVASGQNARLLWNFRDPEGRLIDISDCSFGPVCDESESEFAHDVVSDVVAGPVLRLREITGFNPQIDCVITVPVHILDPVQGLVRSAPLPASIVRAPGIYLEEWGFFSTAGDMLFSNQCSTFVRRGLFGLTDSARTNPLGPPTIEEIRLSLRDNAAPDNPLLDDVEFDAAEIASAVVRPIAFWNEVPPPLGCAMTTKTFPFRELWLLGIQAHLLELAAHHYRRNQLAYNAGGIAVDDKNKEQPYMASAMRLIQRYQELMVAKKISINMQGFGGAVDSAYSYNYY
jgi:hypothetical protein